MRNNDRDKVREAASYHYQDTTEEARKKAESERTGAGQMAVHPPHAKKDDGIHRC